MTCFKLLLTLPTEFRSAFLVCDQQFILACTGEYQMPHRRLESLLKFKTTLDQRRSALSPLEPGPPNSLNMIYEILQLHPLCP